MVSDEGMVQRNMPHPSPVYGGGTRLESGRETSKLDEALQRASSIRSRLDTANDKLRSALLRVRGSVPSTGVDPMAKDDGDSGSMHLLIHHLVEAENGLEGLINQLCELDSYV